MNLKSKLDRYLRSSSWEINCKSDNLIKTQEQTPKKIQIEMAKYYINSIFW